MSKNIWTRQFLFILMRPKLFWTSKWTGQKLRSCANHAIVPLSTIGGNKASFKPLLNIIKLFLGNWYVTDCYCCSWFIPFFAFGTWSFLTTKLRKYCLNLFYILQDKMGKTEKNRKENHAPKVTKIPKTKRWKYGMSKTLL